jgi:hypothetical protein
MKMTADKKALRQMGRFLFPKYCKNLGIDFEDCYFMMFGKHSKHFGELAK